MRSMLVACTVGLALAFGTIHAQPPTGTAQVVGRVLDVDSHAPIAGARVMLLARSSGAAGLRTPQVAVSDVVGEFAFAALIPGRYVLWGHKPGFVSEASTEPLDVTSGQTVAVDVLLKRGGVLAGRILNERGDPMSNARVTAMNDRMLGRDDRFAFSGSSGVTNDLGEFRIAGLADGEYVIRAAPQSLSAYNTSGLTEATAWAPTYYPGTTHQSEAHTISVRAAETVSGLEFQLVSTPAVRVSGMVVDEAGQPVGDAMVTVRPRPTDARRGFVPARFIRANPDGTFAIVGLADGEYELAAVRMVRTPSSGSTFVSTLDLSVEGAEQQITLDGSAVTGLILAVQRTQ